MIWINVALIASFVTLAIAIFSVVMQWLCKGGTNGTQKESTPEKTPSKDGDDRADVKVKISSSPKTGQKRP